MAIFGRFHLIRVLLVVVFVILFIAIVSKRNEENSVIKLSPRGHSESLTWIELEEISQVNATCPLCFGKDACQELMSDVTKGALQVSREPQNIIDAGQTIHGIYRNGKVRFWMKPKPPSPSLLQGFENYICVKAGKDKTNCDISEVAKKSEFLFGDPLDLNSIRGIYKYHLISRRRIPATICPSWKFVQGLIQAFDDNDDQTLTADEKTTLITTLASNPEIALYKFILNQKVQIPILPYFGACGRLTFVQGPYKPLSSFISEPLALRAHLSAQVLQLIDGFIQDDVNWLLFTRDLSYDNFIVTDANQVFLKDLSHVMLIDKDAMQGEDNNNDDWTDESFDEFYDKLVDVKHDDGYQEQCSRIFDYAGHMFSLVCSFVLSDLEKDLENRRGNPLAKSYPGLLHHLDEKDVVQDGDHQEVDKESKPIFENIENLESLIEKCSRAPNVATRHESALQLLQELTFENEDNEIDADDEDDDENGEEDDKDDEDIGNEDLGHNDYEKVHDDPTDDTGDDPI